MKNGAFNAQRVYYLTVYAIVAYLIESNRPAEFSVVANIPRSVIVGGGAAFVVFGIVVATMCVMLARGFAEAEGKGVRGEASRN